MYWTTCYDGVSVKQRAGGALPSGCLGHMGLSVLLVEGIHGRAWREGGCMVLAPGTWRGWTGSEGEQSRDRDRDMRRNLLRTPLSSIQ